MPMPDGHCKNVLDYLRDMAEVCKKAHRADLEDEYAEAWNLAAEKIYGPLPPRRPSKGHYLCAPAKTPGPPPRWKRDMLDKPYRKIVARFAEVEDGLTTEYEQLECGHAIRAGIDLPGSPPAKRRRCAACAPVALDRRPMASAAAASPKKGATA